MEIGIKCETFRVDDNKCLKSRVGSIYVVITDELYLLVVRRGSFW